MCVKLGLQLSGSHGAGDAVHRLAHDGLVGELRRMRSEQVTHFTRPDFTVSPPPYSSEGCVSAAALAAVSFTTPVIGCRELHHPRHPWASSWLGMQQSARQWISSPLRPRGRQVPPACRSGRGMSTPGQKAEGALDCVRQRDATRRLGARQLGGEHDRGRQTWSRRCRCARDRQCSFAILATPPSWTNLVVSRHRRRCHETRTNGLGRVGSSGGAGVAGRVDLPALECEGHAHLVQRGNSGARVFFPSRGLRLLLRLCSHVVAKWRNKGARAKAKNKLISSRCSACLHACAPPSLPL